MEKEDEGMVAVIVKTKLLFWPSKRKWKKGLAAAGEKEHGRTGESFFLRLFFRMT